MERACQVKTWIAAALAVVGTAAACSLALFTDEPVDGGDGATDADGGSDADADADGDADVEADADGDADVEAEADGAADGEAGRPVGAFCNLAEQCVDGLVPGECLTMIWAIEAPDGYCTGVGCQRDDDCPGGAAEAECVEMYAGIRVCLDRCTVPGDCRTGYGCIDFDDAGPAGPACLASCSSDAPCLLDQVCDLDGRPPLCHEPAGSTRRNGEACEHHSECGAGSYCLAEQALFAGWPRGYCTQDCATGAECTNGGACVLSCVNDDDAILNDPCDDDTTPGTPDPNNHGLCMETCTLGPDACSRPGYTCQTLGPFRTRNHNVCAASCDDGSSICGEVGWICDPNAGTLLGGASWGSGRCQPPLDTTALGNPCALTSGCLGGMCLGESVIGYPRGICTEECGPGDDCPTPFVCTGAGLFSGLCFRPCTVGGDDCRPGTECQDLGWGVTTCAPACAANADCDNTCCSQYGTGYCDPARARCMM
jgi:hypothetical protein